MEIKTQKQIVESTFNNCLWERNKKFVAVEDVRDLLKEFMHEIPDMMIKKFEEELS